MINEYVRWRGQLAIVLDEILGTVIIKILKTGEIREVAGVDLVFTHLRLP